MNEEVKSCNPISTYLSSDLAAGAVAGLIAGLGLMTVVALVAIVSLSKATLSKPTLKARTQTIKMAEVELAVQLRLSLESELKRLLRLLPKIEQWQETKLTKRIAQVRKKILFLKDVIKPGSLRRGMKQDSRACMREHHPNHSE